MDSASYGRKETFHASMECVINGNLAEWLRRGPAKPVRYACVGSNPTVVGFFMLPNTCARIAVINV